MVGKFLLIFILARLLPPAELGIYGLLVATVSYALYLVGLEFYTYSTREFLRVDKQHWPAMLRDQAVVFLCCYIVVIPLLAILFWAEILPKQYAFAFYVLLVVEHLSQEIIRLLVAIGKPLAAGVFLFIRSGAWCYAIVVAYLAGYSRFDLHTVIWLWIAADLVVVSGGAWMMKYLPWSKLPPRVDWGWIKNGLKVAIVLLVGTLLLRGIFTVDRYLVEAYAELEMLGVYTLYAGICFSLIAFVDSAVFSFQYPRLIALFSGGELEKFNLAKKKFTVHVIFATGLFVLLLGVFANSIMSWIGRPIYNQYLQIYFVLLSASAFFSLSHIPHYLLYSIRHDRKIVYSHFSGFVLFALLGLLVGSKYGTMGIAISLHISVVVIGVIKLWSFHSHMENIKKGLNK